MNEVASLGERTDGTNLVLFHCPGCGDNHQIWIGTWTFNGDLVKPTITPSILVRGNQWPKDEYPEYYKANHPNIKAGGETVCHSFVTDGRIQYLGDCTHILAGQTVDLPIWRKDTDEDD